MAQPNDPNQTKAQAPAEESAEAQDLSLDQLDSMILSEAPDFANDLKNVAFIPSDGSIDLDVPDPGENYVPDNPWKDTIGIRKVLVTILPFLPKLWEFQYRTRNKIYLFRTRLKTALIEAGPRLLQASKNSATATKAYSKERVTAFKSLNRPMKAVAAALIVAAGLTFAFIYRSMTRGVLPPEKEFLTASLEEWAVHAYKYDPDSEMDSFYDSPRTIQNIMSLPKMVVNIRPSPSSGPNPMAAMEFFLEGLSPEAIVEVKDRESEIRDLFQRTIEEMSYAELESTEGKQQLTEKLRQSLNINLTKGKIRRVFFKEVVIKP
ncbi:flagellar basal body-associated protein FliL [Bdellovibrio sp. HCB337]|uniref:flagellar basal body-associated FliL family protein n=1 Tax=Bdellovibrio sp. HCB337 TaxID=3394358 RepID=UPI0039A6424F